MLPIVLIAEIISFAGFDFQLLKVCKTWNKELIRQRQCFQPLFSVSSWCSEYKKFPFCNIISQSSIQAVKDWKHMPSLKNLSIIFSFQHEASLFQGLPITTMSVCLQKRLQLDEILEHCPSLVTLKLSGNIPSSSCRVDALKQLRHVRVGQGPQPIVGHFPTWISQCVNLESLIFIAQQVGHEFVEDKKMDLPLNLKRLYVNFPSSNNVNLMVPNLPKGLINLSVRTATSDSGTWIKRLNLPHLRYLSIDNCVVNAQDLRFDHLPSLTKLSVSTKANDSVLLNGEWLTYLKYTKIYQLKIGGSLVNHLDSLHLLNDYYYYSILRVLDLDVLPAGDLNLNQREWARNWDKIILPSLEWLTLTCYEVTWSLLKSLKDLKKLWWLKIRHVLDSSIKEIEIKNMFGMHLKSMYLQKIKVAL